MVPQRETTNKRMNWTPLVSEITESSVWDEPHHVRLAWITILAKKDYKTHVIETNAYLLGRMARITEEEAQQSLDMLLAPDRRSRNTENEGRRLKRLDGNRYLVLSGERYSRTSVAQRRKAEDAEWHARAREAARLAAENGAAKEPDINPQRNPAESCGILSDAPTPLNDTPLVYESSAASKRFVKPSLDEVKLACAKCGLPESEAERFWNYYDSVGWKVGKNPMKSWTSALAGTWKSNWQERNQQQTALPKKKEISVFDSL